MITLPDEIISKINYYIMLKCVKYKKNINFLIIIRNGSTKPIKSNPHINFNHPLKSLFWIMKNITIPS
jgi:hypothetical protein